jgi:hypothetical protein
MLAVDCDYCKEPTDIEKITKVGYRYVSKTKKYVNSGRNFIITGHKFVCPNCMKYFK